MTWSGYRKITPEYLRLVDPRKRLLCNILFTALDSVKVFAKLLVHTNESLHIYF